MNKRAENRPLLIAFVAAVSLLVHAPVLLAVVYFFPPTTDNLEDLSQYDPIELVDDPEEDEEAQQIVSLDKPEVEEAPPEKTKLIDRYNQKVEADKETVRKRDTRRTGAKTPIRSPAPQPQITPKTAVDKAETDPTKTPDAPDPKGNNTPEVDTVEAADTTADNIPQRDTDKEKPGEDPNKEVEGVDLDPSKILPGLNMAGGEGGAGDGIKDYLDVPEGDKDLLNRKKVRYWAFFDRMKAAVRQHWRPNDVYRVNDPRRQVYGVEDRMTILKVVLNGDGSLGGLYVEKPSGVPFLDDEAVRAFRAAAPFPNPPEAIKDDKGQVSLRFGFFLNIQTSGSRIIRFRR